jgi:asparagine synthetase B (glutamine-hydrolysing)
VCFDGSGGIVCGIIGAIGEISAECRRTFSRARDLMTHRGPDDAGEYVDRSAMLGFRRLAILDLSCSGHQPMTSPDGRVTLVFNGEIYNYLELRRELEAEWPFRSQSDSEVLLNGYRAWGWEHLLSRMDGMYAFAIWDEALRSLFAARDRAGKKPFFYAEAQGAFRFASSLNALVGDDGLATLSGLAGRGCLSDLSGRADAIHHLPWSAGTAAGPSAFLQPADRRLCHRTLLESHLHPEAEGSRSRCSRAVGSPPATGCDETADNRRREYFVKMDRRMFLTVYQTFRAGAFHKGWILSGRQGSHQQT